MMDKLSMIEESLRKRWVGEGEREEERDIIT